MMQPKDVVDESFCGICLQAFHENFPPLDKEQAARLHHAHLQTIHFECMRQWACAQHFLNVRCPCCNVLLSAQELKTLGRCDDKVFLVASLGSKKQMQPLLNSANLVCQMYTPRGDTLLHVANQNWADSEHVTPLLMERGADLYAQNQKGDTPLHLAIRNLHFSAACAMAAKWDPIKCQTLANDAGTTPFQEAMSRRDQFSRCQDEWRAARCRDILDAMQTLPFS